MLCALFLWAALPALGRLTWYSAGLAMPEGALSVIVKRFAAHFPISTPDVVIPALPPSVSDSVDSADPLPPNTQTILSPDDIPDEYRGVLVQETMAGTLENNIPVGEGYLRNYTTMSADEIAACLAAPAGLRLAKTPAPQVLIVHTHATESYEVYDGDVYDTRHNWRSLDNNINVVRLGEELANALEEVGIGVIHDTTKHDYPSYNGSYDRAAVTIQSYLEKHPTIQVVLDIHRDAISREGSAIVKPVAEINGAKAAQVMIIAPCDDGSMNMPHWRENFRFAVALQNTIESDYPTLTRPVFFCYRKYNMDLTTGSLLLEFGSNANTLDEAIYAARLVGKSLGNYLNAITEEDSP